MYYLVNISSEVTVKGFKKCCTCISNAVDVSEGGMLWNGNEED
jgi:hypothetical protein